MNKLFMFIFLILPIAILMSCSGKKTEGKTIEQITNVNFNSVDKISFLYGNGDEADLKDKDKIGEFIKYIKSYNVRKSDPQPELIGFKYMVTFISNKSPVLKLTFGNPLNLDGIYYDVISTDMNDKILDEFWSSLTAGSN